MLLRPETVGKWVVDRLNDHNRHTQHSIVDYLHEVSGT